jgi:predicted transcriptional regulator
MCAGTVWISVHSAMDFTNLLVAKVTVQFILRGLECFCSAQENLSVAFVS